MYKFRHGVRGGVHLSNHIVSMRRMMATRTASESRSRWCSALQNTLAFGSEHNGNLNLEVRRQNRRARALYAPYVSACYNSTRGSGNHRFNISLKQ